MRRRKNTVQFPCQDPPSTIIGSSMQANETITPSSLAVIGIGSNLQDPLLQCQKAIQAIENLPYTQLIRCSQLVQTKPLLPEGVSHQETPWYINGACLISTEYDAMQLFNCLQEIENDMGRTRHKKWESRLIDLDLLFFENQVLETENLCIPHPEIQKRDFVLEPLREIIPHWQHPTLHKTIEELASELSKDNHSWNSLQFGT